MKIAEKLVNRSEELVFRELSAIAADNTLHVFPKMRVQDVLVKGKTVLKPRAFDYYTRAHFDFILADHDNRPVMAIEYDGPFHSAPEQIERDAIKGAFCKDAGFPLLRINANHVIRRFRGMTLLRWIVEVQAVEKAFTEAQEAGSIPYDETFERSDILVFVSIESLPPHFAALHAGYTPLRLRAPDAAQHKR